MVAACVEGNRSQPLKKPLAAGLIRLNNVSMVVGDEMPLKPAGVEGIETHTARDPSEDHSRGSIRRIMTRLYSADHGLPKVAPLG